MFALVTALLALLSGATASHAGPLDEAFLRRHLEAIAKGTLEPVAQAYAHDAVLDWVGGGLEGRYSGRESIRAVWARYLANQAPVRIHLEAIESHTNDKGATVIASVLYAGRQSSVKVRQAMSLRDGKINTEIWQIAPGLAIPQGSTEPAR